MLVKAKKIIEKFNEAFFKQINQKEAPQKVARLYKKKQILRQLTFS
tara:strand:- start:5736 stop:5873 length:138 start_codon:yes stop_codon:yes gene_type:complete